MTVRIHICLSDQMHAVLKERAEKTRKTISGQIRESLEAYFGEQKTTVPDDPVWLVPGEGGGRREGLVP